MRVLFVVDRDPRGSTHRLAALLRANNVADARVVALGEPHGAVVPTDIARIHDGGQELEHLLGNADVVHLVDLLPDSVPLLQRQARELPAVLQWNRPLTAREAKETDQLRGRGAEAIGTIPGLLGPGPEPFLPEYIPTNRAPWRPLLPDTRRRAREERVRVCCASLEAISARPKLEALIEHAEETADVRRNVLVEVLARRCPIHMAQRQRRANVVLAASHSGIPSEALQGLAQGLPVVLSSTNPQAERYARLAGGILPPVFFPDELAEVVDSAEPMGDPDEALRAWAQCVLDPRRWLGFCSRTYAYVASPRRLNRAA